MSFLNPTPVEIFFHSILNDKLASPIFKRYVESLPLKGNEKVSDLGAGSGSVSDLPFEDNSFDLVTAFETYYFWPDLINDLKEIKRILKPDGVFLMSNEAHKDDRFKKNNSFFIERFGMQLHTPDELRDIFNQAGYSRIEIVTIPEKSHITVTAKN